MKKIHIIIAAILGILIIYFLVKNYEGSERGDVTDTNNIDDEIGLILMKKHCYVCHSVLSNSHDEIIAPPMAAVKWRYSMRYSSKEDFVSAMVQWSMDPDLKKSIMPGAVDKFKVMPKQPFDSIEIVRIVNYIYDNELEEPEWFKDHQKEMHPMNENMGKNR